MPFCMRCERRNMRTRKQKRHRRLLPLVLVVLCLLAVGAAIALTQREKIEELEYPKKYSEYVQYYAGKYGLDPLLLYTFIRTESNFKPDARSNVDARGLMQITEITFDWIKSKIAPQEALTFADLYDPETNIRFGSYFVAYCLQRYDGDVPTAAAAYHSGWGTVDALLAQAEYSQNGRTLDEFPYRNMRQYVSKITHAYRRYQEIYAGE